MYAHKDLKQRGDTIIEVLIAMAVASSVLALTYATMNRSLTMTRDAQERTEASKLAQGQIEQLRVAISNGEKMPNSNKPFCMVNSKPVTSGYASGWAPDTDLAAEDFSKYAPEANCPKDATQTFFNYAIVGNAGIYHVYVRWDKLGSDGRNQVIYVYKQ